MEKYEINKYLATFSEQVDDLYQSLNIEKLNNELPILAKKVEDPNLWNDPQNANKIIANYNSKKENVSIYNEMSSKLSDMKDSLELIDDPEYAKILEDEIIPPFQPDGVCPTSAAIVPTFSLTSVNILVRLLSIHPISISLRACSIFSKMLPNISPPLEICK